ncbi:ABC transporter substrate-binding protein [Nesterenkonia salmonea]|uniref:ABC transporter substrate-binding protein n=1 Tax=Nesterenkonia salmonea TaxID=1804987 RepID=UPI00140A5462|nr:ABC transporter substrate-binding protein [Nesterenkonia salmonea]
MKLRKLSAAAAIMASGALVLSGCTPGDDGENGNGDANGGADNGDANDVVYGEEGDFTQEGQAYIGGEPTDGTRVDLPEDFETREDTIVTSPGGVPFVNYNNDHTLANSVNNSVVAAQIHSGFWYYGTDLSINQNEDFGSFEITEEGDTVYVEDEDGEPEIDEETGEAVVDEEASTSYVIEYNINDEAVWSDETPITVLDYKLQWASQAYDEDAGFEPSGATVALYLPEGLEAEAYDSKTFTAEMPAFNADWQLMLSGPGQPAHLIAEEAGMTPEELNDAIDEGDVDALEEVAPIWNTGLGHHGEWDENQTLSSGPYQLAEWNWEGEETGGSVVLEPNENYWGTPPGTETLIFQFSDESTHVQALENLDYHVVSPQPDEDVADALRGLADSGDFIVHEGDTATWEHIDFQYEQGPFADTPELAEAFALCLPRQEIVEQIIQPINPEAEVLNAREIFNYQDGYDEFVEESYDGRYDEADIDAAAEIIEEHDAEGTDIQIHHFDVPRRSAMVEIIDTYCGEEGAGFNIVEQADANWSPGDEGWEGVGLFAWAGSGQIISGQNIYSTEGNQNTTGYSNEEVDRLWTTVADDVSDEERTEALIEIEQHLWDDLHGIPIFAHPGMDASDASIANVRSTAAQTQIHWNAEQWQRYE